MEKHIRERLAGREGGRKEGRKGRCEKLRKRNVRKSKKGENCRSGEKEKEMGSVKEEG